MVQPDVTGDVQVLGQLSVWRLPATLGSGGVGGDVQKLCSGPVLLVDCGRVRSATPDDGRRLAQTLRQVAARGIDVHLVRVTHPVYRAATDFSVLSVLGTYRCERCDEERLAVIELRHDGSMLAHGRAPARRCPVCSGRLQFLGDPAKLYEELKPGDAPASVEQYQALMVDVARQRSRQVKRVEGDVTWLWLAGRVGADVSMRRLAHGLEGRVVFDFWRAQVDPLAIEVLVAVIDEAARAAQVCLWRVSPSLLGLLAPRLSPAVKVASLGGELDCARCGASAQERVSPRSCLEAISAKTPLELRCLVCDEPMPQRFPDELGAALESRAADVPDDLIALEGLMLAQELGQSARPWVAPDSTVHLKIDALRSRMDVLLATPADVSERAVREMLALLDAAESALEEEALGQKMLNAVNDVGKMAHVLSGVDELIPAALDILMRTLGATSGGFFLTSEGGQLKLSACRGVPEEAVPGLLALARQTMQSRRPLRTVNAGHSPASRRTTALWAPITGVHPRSIGALFVMGPDAKPGFSIRGLAFVESFATHAAMAIARTVLATQIKEEKRQRKSLSRYFSEGVVAEILQNEAKPEMGGVSRRVTVLFTDIRNSTALLELLNPRDAVTLLNEYFTEIIDEVLQEKGTLDKFTGDGIMAFWGAPTSQPDHAVRAARAALRIQQRLPLLQEKWKAEGRPFWEKTASMATGIGIHTGEVVVGNIGSHKRMEYTAIGDTVNVTARIQGLATGGEVLVSESVVTELQGAAEAEPRPPATLKGRTAVMKLYRLLRLRAPEDGPPEPPV